jgi:hypothetical protein
MSNELTKKPTEHLWLKSVNKFRNDIAIANPVSFLVQVMNGQEFGGEKLSLRDRVEVAKYLAGRIVPGVSPEERGLGSGGVVTPPPLTIIMHATPAEVGGSGLRVAGSGRVVDTEALVDDDSVKEG